jgi:hypothetical protein
MTSAEASGSGSVLFLSSPNKPSFGNCLINALTQKGWSLQIPIHVQHRTEGKLFENLPEATAKIFPVRWPHPLTPAENLPSYQVLNIQAEYITTGKYDNNLLYDTAQLISFPGLKLDSNGHATIQLSGNKEETIGMTISIPSRFPDDLLNKPIFVEVLSRIECLGIESSLTLCILVIS